jgi:TusA-related sulfurtransferase
MDEINHGWGIEIHRELNLKGKICPYTFIDSMLTLEEMAL